MSANTQAVTAPKVSKVLVLEGAEANDFAKAMVQAKVGHGRAIIAANSNMLDKIVEAVTEAGLKPFDLAAYNAAIQPYMRKQLDFAVEQGKLEKVTAASYGSRLKNVVLALASGAFKANEREGFQAYADRAAVWLTTAKLADGTAIRPQEGKTGSRAAPKAPRAPTGGAAIPPTSGNAPEFKGTPKLAAALILADQNESRAKALEAVFAKPGYVAEFDKWVKALITKA